MTLGLWKSPWTLTIVVATLADFAVRFALPFDMKRVLLTEAVLFPATGLVLLWLVRRLPRRRGWRRGLQWVLIAAFFLGGLRSGLWGLGFSVTVANFAPLGVAVFGLLGFWILRRVGRIRQRVSNS
jgi:drug/metabolite transporter (DMT)-like permease